MHQTNVEDEYELICDLNLMPGDMVLYDELRSPLLLINITSLNPTLMKGLDEYHFISEEGSFSCTGYSSVRLLQRVKDCEG